MKRFLRFIFPPVCVILGSLFFFTNLENLTMDNFQKLLPSTKESPSVLMVNVDDASVENIGAWPFSRDIYADVFSVLKECGARSIVTDLLFVDKSPAKVDENYVNQQLPAFVKRDFDRMNQGLWNSDVALNDILVSISYTIRPLDKILADSFKLFGNSYTSFIMKDDVQPSDEAKKILKEKIALKNIKSEGDTITPEYKGIRASLPEILNGAKSAGFVNADVDSDGYLRRMHLLAKYDGDYYPQLIFMPVLDLLGNPEIEVSDSYIILKNAEISENLRKDIKIPRNKDGSIFVKYPAKFYDDYNCTSLWNIYRIRSLEKNLLTTIEYMSESGLMDYWKGESPAELYEQAEYIEDKLKSEEDSESGVTYSNYLGYKDKFYNTVESILKSDVRAKCLEEVAGSDELVKYVNDSFEVLQTQWNDLKTSVEQITKLVKNACCIFGTSATSTTDFGMNLFEDHYPNPGVHYSLTNMILSQDFVSETPYWIVILIALIFSYIYCAATFKIRKTWQQIITGGSVLILSFGILLLIFITMRIYAGALAVLVSVFLTFLSITLYDFLEASREKKFITNAFSQCLSKEVVKQIVSDPDSFKLGGKRLEMTAIFTDIQKFSSFSELVTPAQLVALLNYYLTIMSDIIMAEGGTIDKYEGDAIIALVGAPVDMTCHAEKAVSAALKMKAAEVKMNEFIQKTAENPRPEGMDQNLYDSFKVLVENHKTIFTRIGINSGEMIAGYMGSENKKNYTMMGNNVNLASRLEGVNKQYSTGGILISEETCKLLSKNILVRRLDRVRVVNVNTPVRLYEPLGFRNNNEKLEELINLWEKSMDEMESGNYESALNGFEKVSALNPEDKVCLYYKNLIKNFFMNGKYPVSEDGIGVEFIPAEGVYKLLQK